MDEIVTTRLCMAVTGSITGQPFAWATYIAFPGNQFQIAYTAYDGTKMAFRVYIDNSWSNWVVIQ